jgi:hypothetical protein
MTGGKHTPGPWRIGQFGLTNDGESFILSDHADMSICTVTCQTPFKRGKGWRTECETREANARLIAAAPEMLPIVAALAALPIGNNARDDVPVYGLNGVYITHGDVRKARAAIAKAEGGEP